MDTKFSNGNRRVCRLAMTAVMSLMTAAANAEISAAQSDAMAANSYNQLANVIGSVLAVCANSYPNTRAEATKAIKYMGENLEDQVVENLIDSIGRCKLAKGAPTRTQCSDLATQLQAGQFDPDHSELSPMLIATVEKLKSCRRKQ